MQIFISIDQQKLHLYSDGTHVADTSVATGVPSLPTPTGVFSVIQKQVFHRSNIYSGAPMPFMQRITWSGVALHEGENIGHPASHGCIRMPGEFAARLYKFTKIGARVIVARGELKPTDFADPHLFVHKDMQAASLPSSAAMKTAQTVDSSKASDAGSADAALPAKPAALGLRGSANVTPSFVLASDDVRPDADAAKPDAQVDAAKPAVAADASKPEAAKIEDPKTEAAAAAYAKAAPAPSADPKAEAPAVTGSTPAAVAPAAIAPVIAAPEAPAPLGKPADAVKSPPIKKSPIAIFISRKEKKIYVRQDFEPVFEEAMTIEHPEEPMGTHVFTAMEYLARQFDVPLERRVDAGRAAESSEGLAHYGGRRGLRSLRSLLRSSQRAYWQAQTRERRSAGRRFALAGDAATGACPHRHAAGRHRSHFATDRSGFLLDRVGSGPGRRNRRRHGLHRRHALSRSSRFARTCHRRKTAIQRTFATLYA